MSHISRREFTKRAVFGIAAATLPYSRVLGANEDVRVAIIGLNIKGNNHIEMFSKISGCRITLRKEKS